jgi:pilus assembly protein CpaB
MNSRKRMITGIVSAVLAIVCVVVYAASVRSEASAQREQSLARYGGEQVQVCVATKDILPGQTISRSNTMETMWIANLLPEECVTSFDEVDGLTASQQILANEPLSRARLEGGPEALDVPEGLCAVSVPADDVHAVGGAVVPGSVLDVYAHTSRGSVLLGSRLLVLATSGGGTQSSSLTWITLAVTPESVQELLDVSAQDELYFVLPGQETESEGEEDGTDG